MRLSLSMSLWSGCAAALVVLTVLPFVIVGRTMPGEYPVGDNPAARIATFPGGSIRYEVRGTGDTVLLLLHGFNAELGQWNGVWDALEAPRDGSRHLRIDIPGYGASEWRADDYGLASQAERVIALLDRLGIRKVHVAGTSMGASLTAWLAAHHADRVEAIVLFAPSGWPGSLDYPGIYGRLLRPGAPHQAAEWIARTRLYERLYPQSRALQALTVTRSYDARWTDALGRIAVPTLIVWSRGDRTANYSAAAAVQRAIRDSTLVSLDESAGHSIPASRPRLAAAMAGLMMNGVAPADIPGRVPQDLWLQGERP